MASARLAEKNSIGGNILFTKEFFIAIAVIAVFSYLLGSLSGAVIVSKLYKHDDVRKYGSKNAGMTNMLRTYGKLAAFFTFLIDFSKGVISVLFARYLFSYMGVTVVDPGYIAGVFVLLGHLHPLYFEFKGGKGVLTSLGMIAIINPWVFLVIVVTMVPLCFITKIVSLASIIGSAAFPILVFGFNLINGRPWIYDTVLSTFFAITILYMHRQNMKRLLNGTENKFGQK